MGFYDLIKKKRDGNILSTEEIYQMIADYTADKIPDYQMAAMAMAIYFQGMNKQETTALTLAMAESGQIMDLSSIKGVKVDKHSTGGVGDKTTLVLMPLLAALGFKICKMSGRGLGHTGGTVDKLEGIKGFSTELGKADLFKQVEDIGIAIVGQTTSLAPADKKLYSLRDVTATVDILPLIASSVMSKKIAGGADIILLDIKVGNGAFMEELAPAKELANLLTEIGHSRGKKTICILSQMDQPLGCAVGGNIEVIEAINTLKGQGPHDLQELVLHLAQSVVKVGFQKDISLKELKAVLQSGQAYQKFTDFVSAQKGDLSAPLSLATKYQVKAHQEGFVHQLNALKIGQAVISLGGGREKKEDRINHDVGIYLHKKVGDNVQINEIIADVYAANDSDFNQTVSIIKEAYHISPQAHSHLPVILEQVF